MEKQDSEQLIKAKIHEVITLNDHDAQDRAKRLTEEKHCIFQKLVSISESFQASLAASRSDFKQQTSLFLDATAPTKKVDLDQHKKEAESLLKFKRLVKAPKPAAPIPLKEEKKRDQKAKRKHA